MSWAITRTDAGLGIETGFVLYYVVFYYTIFYYIILCYTYSHLLLRWLDVEKRRTAADSGAAVLTIEDTSSMALKCFSVISGS